MVRLTNILIVILFAVISFFPQPVQYMYGAQVRIFLFIFLVFLIFHKKLGRNLFEIRDWSLGLFLISMLAGLMYAVDKPIALKAFFYFSSTLFLLFYIGKGIFRDEAIRKNLPIIICLCACLVSLIGFAELYFGRNILYEYLMVNPYYLRYVGANSRMMSTQLNPAVMGSYLVACLPFCFYCLRRNGYSRLLGIVSTILSFIAALLTFSRGVFLALTVVSLLYLFKSAKFRVAIFFILLIGLFITSASFQQDNRLKRFSYNRLISGSYDSIFSEYRFSRVKMSLRMLKSHPFFGIGHNHFRPLFNDYCAGGNCKKEPDEFKIPDNMYLSILSESGLIGFAGFLVFIYTMLKKKIRPGITLAVFCAFMGLLVNMGAYDLFYWNNPYMLFCLLCGFLQAGQYYEN